MKEIPVRFDYSARLFDIGSDGYADSIVLATYDLLNYLLHRPVFKLCSYDYKTTIITLNPRDNRPEYNKQFE